MKKHVENFGQFNENLNESDVSNCKIEMTSNDYMTLDKVKESYMDSVSVIESLTEDDFKNGKININNKYLTIVITKF